MELRKRVRRDAIVVPVYMVLIKQLLMLLARQFRRSFCTVSVH
jgi:hypothetical protein